MKEYLTLDNFKLLLEICTAVGALAAAIGVYVAYQQLKILNQTLEDNRKWNKVISAFNIIPNNEQLNIIEEQLNSSFVNLIDRTTPLSGSDVAEIIKPENAKIRILLKNYLNELESYCTAINVGAVCEVTAHRKYSYKLERHFIELKPYIDHLRTLYNEQLLYAELEQVVQKWKKPVPTGKTY
jgi:hypothetical protein